MSIDYKKAHDAVSYLCMECIPSNQVMESIRTMRHIIAECQRLENSFEAIIDECDGKEDADDGIPNTALRCMTIACKALKGGE